MKQEMSGMQGFYGLGIAPKLLETIEKLGFTLPTPIQLQSIPSALEGKDVVGIAQTGTGKTLAYGIPLLQRLAQVKGRGLILVPTRELALQVDEELNKIGRALGLRTAVLIGGQSIFLQKRALKRLPHTIIATPGRLLDHMEQKTVRLSDVRVLILDEADRMLDMGFAPQINRILKEVPRERQTMLFSATMPREIMNLARTHMQLPVQIEIAPTGTTAEHVTQELFVVRNDNKMHLLGDILSRHHGSTLVFTRTKYGAGKVARAVRTLGHTSSEIHSDRTLAQRRHALEGFKKGAYRVLIATDIAARGLDVKGIELVINYDLPQDPEDYVHRIGRTARAGKSGHAISFAMPDQGQIVRDIERLIRTRLPTTSHAHTAPSPSPRPAPSTRRPNFSHRDDDDTEPRRGDDAKGYWMKPRPVRTTRARGFRPQQGGGRR